MILSPDNKELNLRRVAETPERTVEPHWLQQYKALKETPFWDSEQEQWVGALREDQSIENQARYARALLLDVLIQFQLEAHVAREQYERLKETNLWDGEHHQWREFLNRDKIEGGSDRDADTQLLDVLVQLQLDPTAAREQYRRLKKTPLWHENEWEQYWNRDMDEGQLSASAGMDRTVKAQLLDVLVQLQLNPHAAQEQYLALKKTEFWDFKHEQWNWALHENRRHADVQLLDILIEFRLDPSKAKEHYVRLKESPLWNKKNKQWNWYLRDGQSTEHLGHFIDAQLLGILVEKGLADVAELPDLSPAPPLPEAVSF